MQLAPAAGAGIGRMLFDLLLADPEFLPLLKGAAIGGLQAFHAFRDKQTGEIVREPDHRTRLQSLTLLLAQAEGEPIKRVIHQHLGASGQLDVLGAMQESPALLAAVEREVAKAKWKHSGKSASKKPGAPMAKVGPVELE